MSPRLFHSFTPYRTRYILWYLLLMCVKLKFSLIEFSIHHKMYGYFFMEGGETAMAKVSGNTHTQQQLNNYANQRNSNNSAYRANNNNHANQLNPNNQNYNSGKSGK